MPVLNQVIRPFTTKWHRESQAGAFGDEDKTSKIFRQELAALQEDLRNYNSLLASASLTSRTLLSLENSEDEPNTMDKTRHNVFVSYHHSQDQAYKNSIR